jgi:hypothetical protein
MITIYYAYMILNLIKSLVRLLTSYQGMNPNESLPLAADCVPAMVTIQVPDASYQGQPFVYSTRTYVPNLMSPCDAERLLQESVRNSVIAFYMENLP